MKPPHQNFRRGPPREEERKKLWREREPTPFGVPQFRATFAWNRGPHPSGPFFLGFGPHLPGRKTNTQKPFLFCRGFHFCFCPHVFFLSRSSFFFCPGVFFFVCHYVPNVVFFCLSRMHFFVRLFILSRFRFFFWSRCVSFLSRLQERGPGEGEGAEEGRRGEEGGRSRGREGFPGTAHRASKQTWPKRPGPKRDLAKVQEAKVELNIKEMADWPRSVSHPPLPHLQKCQFRVPPEADGAHKMAPVEPRRNLGGGPWLRPAPQFHEKTPSKREEKNNIWGTKSEILGPLSPLPTLDFGHFDKIRLRPGRLGLKSFVTCHDERIF